MIATVPFRFDAGRHEYFIGDQRIPSATQLLEMGGLVNGSQYFTEASRRRGTAVHALAADYDLGVLDLPRLESPHRGYVLGYIAACEALKPSWQSIELADVHPGYRYGVRTDRIGTVFGRRTVCEIKSAAKAKHHAVQTALQALADSVRSQVPPALVQRLTVYVKNTGRFSVEVHEDRRDFDTAMELIRRFCK